MMIQTAVYIYMHDTINSSVQIISVANSKQALRLCSYIDARLYLHCKRTAPRRHSGLSPADLIRCSAAALALCSPPPSLSRAPD